MDVDNDYLDAEALFNEAVDNDTTASGATLAERLKQPKANQEGETKEQEEEIPLEDEPLPEEKPAERQESEIEQLARRLDSIVNRFDGSLRDLNGKFGGLNQRIGQFNEELAAAKQAASATAKKGDDSPTNSEINRAATERAAGDSKRWDQMMEEFPDIANAVAEKISQEVAPLKRVEKPQEKPTEPVKDPRVDDLVRREQEREFEREVELVRTRHPDFEEIGSSDQWSQFVAALPKPMQDMAQSRNGSEVSFVLDLYKREVGVGQPTKSQVNADRNSRLSKAVAAPRGQSQARQKTVSIDEMTPEQLFDYAVRQDEAKASRR